MTIFRHLIPGNVFGISPPLSPVQGTFIVHDAQNAIYAQTSASPTAPTICGFIPCFSDGAGGITQLARDVDACVYNQGTTGFSCSLTGTSLLVSYPSVPVLWNGTVQTLAAGSITQTVSTGTWSLVVGYNWGLTAVQLIATSSLNPSGNYVELCEVAVNTGTNTATTQLGAPNSNFIQTLCVGLPSSASYGIPVSGSAGAMPW